MLTASMYPETSPDRNRFSWLNQASLRNAQAQDQTRQKHGAERRQERYDRQQKTHGSLHRGFPAKTALNESAPQVFPSGPAKPSQLILHRQPPDAQSS